MSVWVHIASLPERQAGLVKVLANLAPDVDGFFLWFDKAKSGDGGRRFRAIQALAPRAAQKVKLTSTGNLGSWGKFHFLNGLTYVGQTHRLFWLDDIHVFCDDDLDYAPGFIVTLLAGLERSPDAAVTVQGYRIASDGRRRKELTWYAWNRIDSDWPIHVPGTGAMAVRHETLMKNRVPFSTWTHDATAYSSDVGFAIWAQQAHVPVMLIRHKAEIFTRFSGVGDYTLVNDPAMQAARARLIRTQHERAGWRLFTPRGTA